MKRTRIIINLPFIICTLLLAFTSSCRDGQQIDSQTHIFGGTRVPKGRWASTVALVKDRKAFCTGIALNPTLVVTAAHCIAQRKIDQLGIYQGEGSDDEPLQPHSTIQKAEINPRYTLWTYEDTHDLAFILLTTPLELPEEAYVKVLSRQDQMETVLQKGTALHIVGFGRRNGYPGGSKWEVETQLTRKTKTELWSGGQGKDSCEGDSGGPAFVRLANGEWRVAALTVGGKDCGEGGRYHIIDTSICWVQEASGIDLSACPEQVKAESGSMP